MKRFKSFGMFVFAVIAMLGSNLWAGWSFPDKPLGMERGGGGEKMALSPGSSGDMGILSPVVDMNFDLANTSNFGLGGAYCLTWSNVTPNASDPSKSNVSPYLGVGPCFSFNNVGDWISSGGNIPLDAYAGFIVIAPDLGIGGSFPQLGVQVEWSCLTGERQLRFDADFAAMLLPNTTIARLW